MRVGTWPNQSSLCRGGAGRLETGVPLRVPPTQQLQSPPNGRLWPSEALESPAPEIPRGAPSFLISALRLEQRRGGARHRPQRPFPASGQSRENKDGGPQGNQDAVPALLERKAQPRGARGSGVQRAPGTPARWTPGAPRRGWLSGSHPVGPSGRGAPQRPPPGQGSQAYLAGSCARCCPSLLQGAALAAARSGLTGANYAVGRGPGPGSGRGASLLHSRAGGRQLGREPVGRRWRPEGAEPAARAPPPPPVASNRAGRGGAAAAASFESLHRVAGEPASLPPSRFPRPGREGARGG